MTDGDQNTSSPRIERKRAARIKRILDTALEVLSTSGYEGFTVERVARELDYTVGAIYRYFASKDVLLVELDRRIIADIAQVYDKSWDIMNKSLDETRSSDPKATSLVPMVLASRIYARLAVENPKQFVFVSGTLASLRRHPEPLRERVTEVLAPLLLTLAKHMDEAVAVKSLEDGNSAERATVFWSTIHGAAQIGKLDGLAPLFPEREKLVERAITTMLRGWGADQKVIDRAEKLTDSLKLGKKPFFGKK